MPTYINDMIRGSGALPLITRSICRIKNIIGFSIIAFVGGESTCVALFESKPKRKSEQKNNLLFVMDYYTGDYFNNLTTITILPVSNDMLIMRFFATTQNDVTSCSGLLHYLLFFNFNNK